MTDHEGAVFLISFLVGGFVGTCVGVLLHKFHIPGKVYAFLMNQYPERFTAGGPETETPRNGSPDNTRLGRGPVPPPRIKNLEHSFREYLKAHYERHSREWAFHGESSDRFDQWQAKTRENLIDLLRVRGERSPLHLERRPVEEGDDCILERLYYRTREDLTAAAYLISPKGKTPPHPVVLCLPGHGGGMNEVLFDAQSYQKQYPWDIVRRGAACLVPEHHGFGERAEWWEADHLFFCHSLLLLGESALGHMLWDLIRAVDALEKIPELDAKRIGCYGISLGGELATLLAAIDTRIGVTCISGFLSSYRSTFLRREDCCCAYAPGLARRMEHEDLAALIAPRPLLVESGIADPHYPVEEAKKAVNWLRRLYGMKGCEEMICQHTFDGGHEVSGTKAFPWFERWLKLEPQLGTTLSSVQTGKR